MYIKKQATQKKNRPYLIDSNEHVMYEIVN